MLPRQVGLGLALDFSLCISFPLDLTDTPIRDRAASISLCSPATQCLSIATRRERRELYGSPPTRKRRAGLHILRVCVAVWVALCVCLSIFFFFPPFAGAAAASRESKSKRHPGNEGEIDNVHSRDESDEREERNERRDPSRVPNE